MNNKQISIERIINNLKEVGSISSANKKGYTRPAYSGEEKEALNWLQEKALKISPEIKVSQDKIGNVFIRIGPSRKPAIAFGSHLDTVPEGGLYDGALGVILGLECIQAFVENNEETDVALELICFVGEEANPLGGTFGSRAIAGLINYSEEYEEKIKRFGYTWEDIISAKLTKKDFHCFIETHIEQGPILENEQQQIGIVDAIAGLLRESVKVNGKSSHSGTTPMNLRNDALVDAAKLIQKINQIANENSNEIVATVGELKVSPNLANVVPGEVELVLEIRGNDWDEVNRVKENIKNWSRENIDVEHETIVEKRPNKLSQTVQSCIEIASKKEEIFYKHMSSGANHDSMSMSYLTDVGMIFLPSKNGISHHPDEYTSWNDIETGAQIMMQSIYELMESYKGKN